MDSSAFWASFPHDPRDPTHASLRASDHDRDLVHQVLAEGYAEGRLDREEHDERSAAVSAARTLGDLPPLVADLVPALPARRDAGTELALATPAELRRRGEDAWRKDVREAVGTFLLPSLICWIIWMLTMGPTGHPWPLWVMLGTGINLVQTTARRQAIVGEHVRRLEKKQARELRRRELGS
ncbi:DUF1707 domain-containing protein [Nocardioides sp. W7]|uniref:DUF1707 SHOCT-like domain-containing protein n=1 Tax=Nocardioides sp. W7 TaxID=2931390 RepID=UPI001FD13C13|nr:DUF1707 domain-containing protein [Nocardioides sp. W7]